MQIVIDIPEELVSKLDDDNYQSVISWYDTTLYDAIQNAAPLPKGHGRLIDVNNLEPDTEWDYYEDGFISYSRNQIEYAHTIIEADKEQRND